MSFRNRLGLFFVLIVIVPMVAVAVLLFGLLAKSERSMRDAAIGARQELAQRLLDEHRRAAAGPLTAVAHDDAFGTALVDGDVARARARASKLLKDRDLERIVLVRSGKVVLAVGDKTAVAPALRPLESTTQSFGELGVSVVDARTYAGEVRRTTGLDVVVRNGGKLLAATRPDAAATPPSGGNTHIEGKRYSASVFAASDFPGQNVRVTTLANPDAFGEVGGGRVTIAAILVGFLLLALACAALVSRSLQQQLAGFLVAARKLASGDFSAKVTTIGRDEFAGLGEEFNKMSRELETRLVELRQERDRVQASMRSLGEAVASKLDRDALLKIVVRTVVDGIAADAGRASVLGADGMTLEERARAGNMYGLEAVMAAAEADALRSGGPRDLTMGEAHAMAYPLRAANGGGAVFGVVSVGRHGRAFTPSERELFHYLAGQAARSMESVDRHETVTRESMTDDLTRLANRRAFNEVLRSRALDVPRLGPLGLALMDIDNFKAINDTYGHPQGDAVLREVARVLRDSSREIDLPARYGGEEFALVLPGTDLEGAFRLAERVRMAIAAHAIPRIDGSGVLRVTVSCGVASMPHNAQDAAGLEAAADAALFTAKRNGKNRTERAE